MEPMQAFRDRSTDRVAMIPTLMDPKTGDRIVFWDDIQAGFKNVESVWKGISLIPFLRDENFKQMDPMRIAYHPDDVLEVVTGGTSQGHYAREVISPAINKILPVDGQSTDHHTGLYFRSSACTSDISTLTRTVDTLAFTGISNNHNQSLVKFLEGRTQDVQSISLAQDQSINSSLQVVMSGQATIMQHLDRLEGRQEQLVQKQDHMLLMQQQALDRLAIIQSSVQSLVSQTYELHEYPIPRLFIVLPKAVGLSGKLKGIFCEQFRLYFLCECGTHTMTDDSKMTHHIHLAKHEGYDLEKPTVFFEKYGNYVLTVMHMIRYGVTAAGLIVPPLASSKIVDGLDTAQKHMEYLKKNINPLVDDTIKFLNDIKNNSEIGEELAADHTEFDQLEALEGADLRQLESYLKVKDQGRVLGNLYRIVTSEGHVKWVCFDHYRAAYRESAIKQLREVVNVNRGKYIEETGRIEIKIASSIIANQFYDAMIKARGIQELEITLEWDATTDDLRAFASAVTKASVVRLTVDGSNFKGPALDVINRSRRFNPILKLASNTRIQTLQLKGFEDFFARVSKSSMVFSPKFRVFSMESGVPLSDKTFKSFSSFLEQCSALTRLEVKLHQQDSITKATSDILTKLPKLESLKVDRGESSIAAVFSQGKTQDMDLTIKHLDGLSSDDLKFIHECHLTRLVVKYTPQKADESQLTDILRHNPRMNHLQIGCEGDRAIAVIDLVVSTRERIIQEHGSSSLRTFELMEENLTPFDTRAHVDNKIHIQSHLSFPEDSDSLDMRTWIRLKWMMEIERNDPVSEFFRRYGWSIVYFHEHKTDNDTFTALLDDIPNTRSLQLESLRINANRNGPDHLDKIIKRSPNFKDLGLSVYPSLDDEFRMAQPLLSQHAAILSALFLVGGNSQWSWFASSFPTRNSLPSLKSFELLPEVNLKLPLKWIVVMVSAPSRGRTQPSPSQLLSQKVGDKRSSHHESELPRSLTPLKKIMLSWFRLQSEEWREIIEAIDFSALECLDLHDSNISQEQFKLLVDCISGSNISNAPLKKLNIRGTDLVERTDSRALEAILADLREKAPAVAIILGW